MTSSEEALGYMATRSRVGTAELMRLMDLEVDLGDEAHVGLGRERESYFLRSPRQDRYSASYCGGAQEEGIEQRRFIGDKLELLLALAFRWCLMRGHVSYRRASA